MPLKQDNYQYKQCDVTTIANTPATIPPGRHPTLELQTGIGGVSIRPAGRVIDIDSNEWKRIVEAGFVDL